MLEVAMPGPPDERLERTDVVVEPRVLAGKYRLGELLGEGGMGAVYVAEHVGLGTKVAVKLLASIWTGKPDAVARFRREARAAAAVTHDNIVKVTDIDADEDGRPFIVMELLRGESLQALLGRQRVLPPVLAAAIVGEALRGLAVAHEAKIIHRDLKPPNILLAQQPGGGLRVKILDFGIAKVLEDGLHDITITLAGAMVGTLRYMAPEQLDSDPTVDHRVDIYSLGVTLYAITTGRLPFGGDTPDETTKQIREGTFPRPREARPELPEALEAVILRAMACKREDRFPDANTFLQALQQAVPAIAGSYRLGTSGSGPGVAADGVKVSVPDIPLPVMTPPEHATVAASPHALSKTAPPPSRRRVIAGVVALLAFGAIGLGWRMYKTRAVVPAPAAERELRFGLAQYLPPEQLRESYTPLAEYLSQKIGRPVKLVIQEDYVDLAQKLSQGELDLVAFSPYSYVRARRKIPNLDVLATPVTSGGSSYEGVVLTRGDSGIADLAGLRGKVFCYTNASSASGYLYPRALFKRAGIDPDQAFKATRFTGDHLGALRALVSGACDGAAVYAAILFEAKQHGIAPDAFRILASTERIPYDAYCTHPKLPAELRTAIKQALLALPPGSQQAQSIFARHGAIIGFQDARDADYDGVRKIERYLDEPPHH
jgi:serine/threonine-protein kinase